MAEKPFLKAHGEVDCIAIVVMLSHFASDLVYNHGSNWLTKTLRFQEVIPKSKNHRSIICEHLLMDLYFALLTGNTPEDMVIFLIRFQFV